MEHCPCCYKNRGTCDCQIQWAADLEDIIFQWCATHHHALHRNPDLLQLEVLAMPPETQSPDEGAASG